MPAWATVVITLGASGIAVAGTLLNGWLSERRATSRSHEEAGRQRLREGAEIVARIEILLVDSEPDRLGITVSREEPFEVIKPLHEDWMTNLRPTLATFALADPTSHVRELGRQLGTAVTNSLIATSWMLGDIVGRVDLNIRDRAKADHAEAVRLTGEFMAAIRDAPGATPGQLDPPKPAELDSGQST